jgi:N-acetylmuramoyl-L-alanine amidase
MAPLRHCLRLALVTLLLATTKAVTAGVATNPPRLQYQGHEWDDLAAWAKTNRYVFTWNRAAKFVQVTNRTERLHFTVDSPQCLINGVKVWLSLPILNRNGTLYVTRLDVQNVLAPLLRGDPRSRPATLKTIVLDPGHGGTDPGNEAGGELEKRHTLLLAQQLRTRLRAAGYRVHLTRSRDVYVGLAERAALANRLKADLFISLHFNSAGRTDPTIRGVEVFYLTPNGAASTHDAVGTASAEKLAGHRQGARNIRLAFRLQDSIIRSLGLQDRGVKRARFAVLRDLTMPAVLVEAGFMSAPEEARKIASADFRRRLADAILEGIRLYQRQSAR